MQNDLASLFYEVEFKGRKQSYYNNPKNYTLKIGEPVIVEAERGVDLGYIRRIFEKNEIPVRVDFQRIRKVLAPASREDLKKLPIIEKGARCSAHLPRTSGKT